MAASPKFLWMVVVFLTPGQAPMGRRAFAAAFRAGVERMRIQPSCEIKEIHVAGEFAYCWNHLNVVVTPVEGGSPHAGTDAH